MENILTDLFNELRRPVLKGLPLKATGRNSKGDTTRYFDKYAENQIIRFLGKKIHYKSKIISEELYKPKILNPKDNSEEIYIVIDPVDGSDNYLKGIPFVCLGIAAFDKDMEPLYSFAGNYYTGEYYYADRKRITIKTNRKNRDKGKPLLIYTMEGKKKVCIPRAAPAYKSVRSMGATIGEMLMVLQGKAVGFVDARGGLTLENFAPFFLAVKHGKAKLSDEKGCGLKIKDFSLTRKYKIIFTPLLP